MSKTVLNVSPFSSFATVSTTNFSNIVLFELSFSAALSPDPTLTKKYGITSLFVRKNFFNVRRNDRFPE